MTGAFGFVLKVSNSDRQKHPILVIPMDMNLIIFKLPFKSYYMS